MIRQKVLYLATFGLATLAWKDWYKSLCGLIVLMAFIEHRDWPKTMYAMQGLNPWNLLLAVIVVAWAFNRKREGLIWDMPRSVSLLFLLYMAVIVSGFFRMMLGPGEVEGRGVATLVSEYLVNPIKFVIPGILLFDGCRTRSRLVIGLGALLAIYVLLAVQVVKLMPPESLLGGGTGFAAKSLNTLDRGIGYHRVNLALMFAGASWAMFATRVLGKQRRTVALILAASLLLVYALALTGGRGGYVSWAVVGLFLCLLRWRKQLVLLPLAAVFIVSAAPGTVNRLLEGFYAESTEFVTDAHSTDLYTVTAGRNIAWPYIIEKIGEAPVIGFGREAMRRTGLAAFLLDEHNEKFGHPHNAYLELLLDSGVVGLALVLSFYAVILGHAIPLFRDSRSPVFAGIGGVTLSLVLGSLVAFLGGESFYPDEGSVGMWCAMGLLLRVSVERARAVGMVEGRRTVVGQEKPGLAHYQIPIWD